jgi:hypothetical protein
MLVFSNSKTPMKLENVYKRCGCRYVWLCCWSMLESEGCGCCMVFANTLPHFCASCFFRFGNKKDLLQSPRWANRVQMAIKEPLTALGFSFSDGDFGIQATSRMGALSLFSWDDRAHELGTDIVVQGLRRRLPPPPSLRFGAASLAYFVVVSSVKLEGSFPPPPFGLLSCGGRGYGVGRKAPSSGALGLTLYSIPVWFPGG